MRKNITQRMVEVAGESVVVQQIGKDRWYSLFSFMDPLITDLSNLFTTSNARLEYLDISTVLNQHLDIYVELLIESTGKDRNWWKSVSEVDGYILGMWFWVLNKRRFMASVRTQVRLAMKRKQSFKYIN